tara:strand:- start:116 stop:1054 length:939 start_codon:yes stop_codon:yes gene_type:complete
MDRLINLFVGGSYESLHLAIKLTEAFESLGGIKCTIWNQGFEYNKSFLDTLTQASYSFDFGVMIATKDDIALIRKDIKDIPRDNIIFEYGLFLGAMGNSRTFLLQEEGANLPSDLLGYTTPRFKADFSTNEWLDLAVKLKKTILEEYSKSAIQILPSTSLAIGYYDSFLKKICAYVCEVEGPILKKNQFDHSSVRINIIIPDELSSDIGIKAKLFFNKNGYEIDEVGDKSRPFPVRFFKKSEDLMIVDIPTTLNAIRPSVDLLIPSTTLGLDKTKSQVERRELENFKKTLEFLVSRDDYSSSIVDIKWESEI